MKKHIGFLLLMALTVMSFTLVFPQESQAVPAFARQTGMACVACHFQHYPALNAFGRAFKAGGYTMVGGQSLLEGELLSLPSVLNASLVLKVRYQKTNGDDTSSGTNKGELQFPDEAALFMGGRVGENVGFLLEMDVAGEDVNKFANFKMPFVYKAGNVNLLAVPFVTDNLGASFGFELLNTGAVRNIRILEHRQDISAQQYVGTDTAGEGFAFVAAHDIGFVNFTLWGPSHDAKDVGPLSKYFRAAVTPNVSGWDLGAGIQWWGGTTHVGSAAPPGNFVTHAWAIDAQAQGQVGVLPLGIYLSYASAEKSKAGEPANVFNSSTNGDRKAFAISAELGVLPNKVTVAAGYRAGDNGEASNNKQNAIAFGVTYQFLQNLRLELDHTFYSGSYYDLKANNQGAEGDQKTTLMLFAAF